MKKIALIVLLGLSALAQAQTDLAGRVYTNPNIMAEQMNKIVAEAELMMDSARHEAYAKAEQKKGRKLTADEKAKLESELAEAREMMLAMKKGMKTSVSVEFKDKRNLVMHMKMLIDDDALKAAGVPWAKRKLMKAAMAVAPSSQKGTYHQTDNLIIIEDKEEPDTMRLSSDGKYLYGQLSKNQKFKLTRTK